MDINVLDRSNRTSNSYTGLFSVCDFIGSGKTKSGQEMLAMEKRFMNDKIVDDLRSYIKAKFGNDIERFAACVGRPAEDIKSFLDGSSDIPPGFFENYLNCASEGGAHRVQIGDTNVEIVNKGDGMTNNYAGLLKGVQSGTVKELKKENSELKRQIKDLKELVESQKITIELLMKRK